jgi:protoporphyrinogen/coproporphyrinogen III oxidase
VAVTVAASRFVVVGGGIAGLAAALRLTTLVPAADVTLIEGEPRLGGKIVTERIDGFVIDGGPDSFLAAKPRGVGLANELGLTDRLVGTDLANRHTFVWRRGRLRELPEGLTGLVPTRLGPLARSSLLSPVGKARVALDYLLPPRRGEDDESLASFVERRLGREAYESLVEPLMAGIYAGDGRALSLAATFPQLRRAEREHGSLIKGVRAGRPPQPPHPGGSSRGATPFLSFAGGLGELVDALAERLAGAGVTIRTGCVANGLARTGDGAYIVATGDGDEVPADAIVLATPAGPTADLLAGLAPAAARALRAVPHVSTATVSLAYGVEEVPRDLRGYGYVVPRVEGRRALACTWVSSKWPGRAPDGFALLRVFVGRAGQEDALDRSDGELVAIARDELWQTLGIVATPHLARLFRWPDGMPQYTLGHLDRVAVVERSQAALPGLAVAGHAYRGVGIPDCIASGEAAAERIVQSVVAPTTVAPRR